MTIKELRIKRGYRTQEEFAKECGVSRPTIANIEQDPKKLYSIKLGTIIVICEKLKIRPDQLIKMAKGE